MTLDIEHELLRHLRAVEAIEQQSMRLMRSGVQHAGDEQVAGIYDAHRRQTEDHIRFLHSRIVACGTRRAPRDDPGPELAAVEIGFPSRPDAGTLAAAAYAHENLEIAAYHLLGELAERAGDHETAAAVEQILEQEEAAAEAVASTFDRAIAVALGEPATSPTNELRGSDATDDLLHRARRQP